jgi:hypothetical protein
MDERKDEGAAGAVGHGKKRHTNAFLNFNRVMNANF